MPFQDYLPILQSIFNRPPTPIPTNPQGNMMPPVTPPNFGGGQISPIPPDVFATPPTSFNPAPQDIFAPIPTTRRGTPALDAFTESVMNPPEWQRPSLLRMLGTIGYSASRRGPNRISETTNADGETSRNTQWSSWNPLSFEEADAIVNMPNRRRIDEWKLKSGGLKEAANVETQRLDKESLATQRYGSLSVAQQREARLSQTAEGRMELDKLKHQLNEWKARNPRGQIIMPRGGNVTIINPVTNEAVDTGIPTGLMTERERQMLIGTQRIDQINTQGLIGDARQEDAQRHAIGMQEDRQEFGREQAQNRATFPQYPTQERVGVQNKVSRLIAMNPKWRDWLTIDENGQPEIEEPSAPGLFGLGGNGLDEKTYWNIVAAVHGPQYVPPDKAQKYGTVGIGQNQQPPPEMNKPNRKWQQNPQTGEWRYSDDGGRTWIIYGGAQ